MPEKLDYSPAPVKQPETKVDKVLKAVLIIGLVMVAFTSTLLDGGRMFALCTLLTSIALIVLSIIAIASTPEGTRRFTALRITGLVAGLGMLALLS